MTRFIRFLSLLPLMTIFSFGAFIVGARHALGHWPVAMIDGPKYIEGGVLYDNLYDLFCTFLGLTIFCGLFSLIALYWQSEHHPKIAKRNFVVFALGWLTIILLGYFDLGHYVEWFID